VLIVLNPGADGTPPGNRAKGSILSPQARTKAGTPFEIIARPFARWCKVYPAGRPVPFLLADTARQRVRLDRRTFLGALAGGLLAARLTAKAQRVLCI